MGLLSEAGISLLARWGHFIAGITWIGLLYYFNLVQVPAFAQMDAGSRTDAIRRLVPRALWWFRWAALATFLTGLAMLILDWEVYDRTLPGVAILSGAFLGTIMLANVWGVIWPNQKVVIANAEATASGGQALPNAAAAGRKAFLASRTNVLLSVTMLFFMGAAHHFAPAAGDFTLPAIPVRSRSTRASCSSSRGSSRSTRCACSGVPGRACCASRWRPCRVS